MICRNCGANLTEGSNNCYICGAPVFQNSVNYVQYPTYSQQQGYQAQSINNSYNPYTKPKYISKFNIGNIGVLIFSILVGISVFCPFITIRIWYSSVSLKLISYNGEPRDGVFFLGLAILIFILNAFKLNTANILFSIITCLLMIYEINYTEENILLNSDLFISYELGYYFLIIGSILLLLSAIVGFAVKISDKKKFMKYISGTSFR